MGTIAQGLDNRATVPRFQACQICFEQKQPMRRLTLVKATQSGLTPVPILKYTLLVGASLLAIIVVAGQSIGTAPTPSPAKQKAASSLEILRKMANHGEMRPFASAAAAGPFLAMPSVPALPMIAAVEPAPAVKPAAVATVASSPLNAQARVDDSVVIKPVRAAKKVASRKPKQRLDYVANVQREPGGFFGAFQSW